METFQLNNGSFTSFNLRALSAPRALLYMAWGQLKRFELSRPYPVRQLCAKGQFTWGIGNMITIWWNDKDTSVWILDQVGKHPVWMLGPGITWINNVPTVPLGTRFLFINPLSDQIILDVLNTDYTRQEPAKKKQKLV